MYVVIVSNSEANYDLVKYVEWEIEMQMHVEEDAHMLCHYD